MPAFACSKAICKKLRMLWFPENSESSRNLIRHCDMNEKNIIENAAASIGAHKMTRRRLFGTAARLETPSTAASSILPPNVRRALAQEPPKQGSFRDIKHVVILMQENRSFDHYFGTLAGVCGFDDPNAMKLPDGKSVFYQPDPQNPNGYLLPFHLDTRKTSAQKIPSTSHAWAARSTIPGTAARWTTGFADASESGRGQVRLMSWSYHNCARIHSVSICTRRRPSPFATRVSLLRHGLRLGLTECIG